MNNYLITKRNGDNGKMLSQKFILTKPLITAQQEQTYRIVREL